MRRLITSILETDPEIKVVGFARNGKEALEKIPRLRPQVVTLDVEMPGLNGLETLSALLKIFPVPVVMLSSLTTLGAEVTLKALTQGAIDFITKPTDPATLRTIAPEIITKVKTAALVPPGKLKPRLLEEEEQKSPPLVRGAPPLAFAGTVKAVAIGCSTGGPAALQKIIPLLPADFPAPVLIVQHMPPGFTRPLAQSLDVRSQIEVKEAESGDELKPGRALIAPAGSQMLLKPEQEEIKVNLSSSSPLPTRFSPSADALFLSIASVYRENALGVILTGMGNDGVQGLRVLKEKGGKVIAEAESSCVVFGMPKAALEAGVVDLVLPLEEISAGIMAAVKQETSSPPK